MREVERRKCNEILRRLGVTNKTVFPMTSCSQNPTRPRNCSPELDEQIKLALVRAEERIRMNSVIYTRTPVNSMNFNCNQRVQYPQMVCNPMNSHFTPNSSRSSQYFRTSRPLTTMSYINFQNISVTSPYRRNNIQCKPVLKMSPNFNNSIRPPSYQNRPPMCWNINLT